jgi:DNA 3'-phosphatase
MSGQWHDLDSLLLYKSDGFMFHDTVIITDFENCLIKKCSNSKVYDTLNEVKVRLYDENFIRAINKLDKCSIICMANTINRQKIAIDSIKVKVQIFIELTKIPILAMFAMRPNKFMKPHTGMWGLLQKMYKQKGLSIAKARVISDQGGLMVEKQMPNTEDTYKKVVTKDLDRAFAHNIGVEYMPICQFTGEQDQLSFKWDQYIIPPEIRKLYVQKLEEYPNPKLFTILAQFKEPKAYAIMIQGAPRSGKTTLAHQIIDKWNASEIFGKHNAIEYIGSPSSKTKAVRDIRKKLLDRISVVIDMNCFNNKTRQPYIQVLEELKVPLLCIMVDCGLEMAKILNHASVEEAKSEDVELVHYHQYILYRSSSNMPMPSEYIQCITFVPHIEQKKSIMDFRYCSM